jgi:hypothetical protein
LATKQSPLIDHPARAKRTKVLAFWGVNEVNKLPFSAESVVNRVFSYN